MSDDAFNRDPRELLVERLKKGEIDRRDFLSGPTAPGGAVGLPAARQVFRDDARYAGNHAEA
jgi:hypothetical protein